MFGLEFVILIWVLERGFAGAYEPRPYEQPYKPPTPQETAAQAAREAIIAARAETRAMEKRAEAAFERQAEAAARELDRAMREAEEMNWAFDHPREAALVREYHQELKEGKWPLYGGKRPDWL